MTSSPHTSGRARPWFALTPAAVIVLCALALTFLGLSILFSASASFKQGPYFYLDKQVMGVGVAAIACFVTSRLNLDYLRQYAWWIGGAMLLLLILVLIPHLGISVKGSRRWLGFGPLRLQVSEFGKLAAVFCLAHYLALNQSRLGELRRGFLYPLAIVGAYAGFIILEPDFGTAALTLGVGLVLLFLAGAKWRYIVPTVAGATLVFTVAILHNPNRLRRMTEFLSEDKSYQLRQGLVAFAAGGLDGVGLGQGRQQLNFMPEAHTDFILSIAGEELGLWCTLGVVALFLTILVAGLIHLRRAPNLFQFLLVAGCLLLICLQAIINIGVVTGVLPTKGMSLPFISAGLSNLMLMGVLLGIIVNTQRTWGRATLAGRGRAMEEVLA